LREVHRLLAAGADPWIRNREGHTALNAAALLGHREIYGALEGGEHLERLLDHALEETFPASDPIAVSPPPRR
jgi:ankyrin repeat protein